MITPLRFALIGRSGSGKSEAGRLLSTRLKIQHVKTGTICRQIARLLFNNEDKQSTQRLDDVLTQLDPSIFLKAALRPISSADSFLLDSLRFNEDLSLARSLGCTIIRITAPDSIRIDRLKARGQVFAAEIDGVHRSELELDDASVDFEISNEGSLDELDAALATVWART